MNFSTKLSAIAIMTGAIALVSVTASDAEARRYRRGVRRAPAVRVYTPRVRTQARYRAPAYRGGNYGNYGGNRYYDGNRYYGGNRYYNNNRSYSGYRGYGGNVYGRGGVRVGAPGVGVSIGF